MSSLAACSLGAIFVSDIVIFSLMAAALASGPGAYSSFLATPVGVSLIAPIIVLIYCVHRVRYPDRDATRNLATFAALSPLSLVTSLMLIIRIPASPQGSLATDFSGFAHPLAAIIAVLTVSCSSTIVAFLSFYVCQNELPAPRVREPLPPAVPRKPSNTVISLYRQPAIDASQDVNRMKTRTTYDDWPSVAI